MISLIEQAHIRKISLGNDSLGLIVDDIGDVIEIAEKDILPPTSNTPVKLLKVISGVIQLEKGVILMLDLAKLYNMICQNTQKETDINHAI
jgi:chemotaxis signal transduction protein